MTVITVGTKRANTKETIKLNSGSLGNQSEELSATELIDLEVQGNSDRPDYEAQTINYTNSDKKVYSATAIADLLCMPLHRILRKAYPEILGIYGHSQEDPKEDLFKVGSRYTELAFEEIVAWQERREPAYPVRKKEGDQVVGIFRHRSLNPIEPGEPVWQESRHPITNEKRAMTAAEYRDYRWLQDPSLKPKPEKGSIEEAMVVNPEVITAIAHQPDRKPVAYNLEAVGRQTSAMEAIGDLGQLLQQRRQSLRRIGQQLADADTAELIEGYSERVQANVKQLDEQMGNALRSAL